MSRRIPPGPLAIVIAGLAMLLALWAWQRALYNPKIVAQPSSTPPGTAISADKAAAHDPDRPGKGDESSVADTERVAWSLAPTDEPFPLPKVRDKLPATLVAIDRSALATLVSGDRVLLPMAGGDSVTFSVDAVRPHTDYGATSYRGSTQANGVRLPAVITLGEDSTLATIGTAAGTYELRGNADFAWLYRATDLGVPGGEAVDYLIPENRRP